MSREQGVTLFMSLLGALTIVLSKYSGQHDISVGSPVANRNQRQLLGLIGFFTNTLVLRTDLSGNPSLKDLLLRIKALTLDAYHHQEVPFAKIVDKVVTSRDVHKNPLFQVMCTLNNQFDASQGETMWADLAVESIEYENHTAQFDLSFDLVRTSEGMLVTINYNRDLYQPTTIARMHAHFERVLAELVSDVHQHVAGVSLLSASEKQALLIDFHAPEVPYPKGKTVVDAPRPSCGIRRGGVIHVWASG
jgi:non-ribosomal peptide synthetase component F